MSDGSRIPRFEIHIRPMFRLLDRDHMLSIGGGRAFDLYDYDAVVPRSESIWAHLKDNMPTIPTGGLWPEEWIALFRRWIDAGHPRLELISGRYSARTNGQVVVLKASAEKLRPDDRIWFDRFSPADSPREYWLYREPGRLDEDPLPADVQERFFYKPGVDTVTVIDPAGPHQVPIARA